MNNEPDLIPLIDEIYKLVGNPTGLQDLLGHIAEWRGADMALLTAPPLPGCAPVPLMAYKMDFTPVMARPDLLMRPEFTTRAIATGRAPGVFTLDELMPNQERETSGYWQAIMAPLCIGSGVLAIVRTAADNMRPVALNLFRRQTSVPFDAEDVRKLEMLMPHLRSALSILLDAPRGAVSFEPDIDFSALSTAVFCLDQTAKVVRCNNSAKQLLRSEDGLTLQGDRLSVPDADLQREIDAVLRRVIGDNWSTRMRIAAELSAPRPSGLPALTLVAIPMGADNPIATAAASVRCVVFAYGDTRPADTTGPHQYGSASWSLRN